jgi:hypothetical protein
LRLIILPCDEPVIVGAVDIHVGDGFFSASWVPAPAPSFLFGAKGVTRRGDLGRSSLAAQLHFCYSVNLRLAAHLAEIRQI